MHPHELVYVGTVNANLICCICCMPFTNPTATTKCPHTFCKDCITAALSFNQECPVDRMPLLLPELLPASTIVRNLVDELLVKCPNSVHGCNHTCQRQLLNNHLSSECLHAPTQCCEVECGEVILRGEVDRHARDCPHRIVMCEACSASVEFKDLEHHATQCPAAELKCSHCNEVFPRSEHRMHLEVCPEVTVPCLQSLNGCPWSGPRRDLTGHTETCPYERIKGFFAINNTRLETLETENANLRRQVSGLEAALAAVRRDVDNAKTSLGPWFRRPTDPFVSTPLPRQERVMRRRLSIPLTTASFPRDSDEGENNNETQEYLGPQVTSGTSVHVSTSTTTEQAVNHFHPQSPSIMSNASFVDDLTLRASMPSYPQHQSRVAPIDLTTSLEGCLNSLRASMVTISAGLDSLERRQDLALTTETLRMHEDVASLRAIVQGLRMQVHSIMMDRNWHISGRSGNGGNEAGGPELSGPHTSHAYGPPGELTTASIEASGISRPYYPTMFPPIQISQMTSMRRTSGMENKL